MTLISGILLSVFAICCTTGCSETAAANQKKQIASDTLENIVQNLTKQSEKLQSYQCRIEYVITQPLFDSRTLRTGQLYYLKTDTASKLRINFDTLQQDDDKQQKYTEQYLFDGLWLTHIDYQSKMIKRYQMAEPNAPVDAFELVKDNLPIIGFTNT